MHLAQVGERGGDGWVYENPSRQGGGSGAGAHIVGPDAGTLIAKIALAMELGASAENLARPCQAPLSLNYAVKEAALSGDGRAKRVLFIHILHGLD